MRRIVFTGLVMVIVLTSCQQFKQTTIQEASLTDFEEQLLNVVANDVFIYDLEITNDEAEEVEVSVDYYEHGDLIETVNKFSLSISEEQKRELFRVAFISQENEGNYIQWSSAIFADGTVGTADSSERQKIHTNSMASSSIMSPEPLEIGEEQIVAHIVYSNDDGGITTATDVETEEDLHQLTNYDHVYILSVKLK